ncbi:hypothetical protein [Ferrovibrio xuzhouensis]|uniref:Uncharacterized protein n=1 Tax=Ferrovibrio xuzhouensis TaxID=1576914 RepID=A0ABV7VFM4_9PROT
MAIAPSNNLLSALSQLQGASRPAGSAAPRGATAGTQRASFSGQITGPAPTAPTASASAPSPVAPAPSAGGSSAPVQSLPRQTPIPSRGGYLGQYVNIVV